MSPQTSVNVGMDLNKLAYYIRHICKESIISFIASHVRQENSKNDMAYPDS